MSAITVVATVEPANSPPRVRIDITDAGTPAINSVTVTRTDNSGRTSTVRTPDGGPLQLTTAGATRVGTVYDYEMIYRTLTTYSTAEQPASTSAQVAVPEDRPWLVHAGVPGRSIPISLLPETWDTEEQDVAQGVFRPLGRKNAVYITDGQRKGPESKLVVGTDTLAELAALRALIDDAGVLLMNLPADAGFGVDSAYIGVGRVSIARVSDIGTDPGRAVTMPYAVVDQPVGGSQAQWTWADVIARYPTWQAVMNANATWAALQAPTT